MPSTEPPEIDRADYRAQRKLRGTQQTVADQLGVHRVTITKRETGAYEITRETWLALLSLPLSKKLKR